MLTRRYLCKSYFDMRLFFTTVSRRYKALIRKVLWYRYSWLATAHGFNIERHSANKGSKFLYLNESPYTITKVDGVDLSSDDLSDKIIYSNFDKPDSCVCAQWFNKSSWLCLMDQHVSMPKNVLDNFQVRQQKAILIRSSKKTHPGHIVRNHFIANDLLDIIDTDKQDIFDLRAIYEQYQYVLIIENIKFPGYVSEQIWGAIKSGCIPIYYGASEKLTEYNLSNVATLEDCCSSDYKSILKLPVVENINFAKTNFSRLVALREDCLSEFMAFPTMFLIRGDR